MPRIGIEPAVCVNRLCCPVHDRALDWSARARAFRDIGIGIWNVHARVRVLSRVHGSMKST